MIGTRLLPGIQDFESSVKQKCNTEFILAPGKYGLMLLWKEKLLLL